MLFFIEQGGIVLDIVGDLIGVADDAALMLLHIMLGDIDGAAERVLHPAREPGLQTQIERHRREDRDQDGGHHRDGAEPGHQPDMQARAGAARFALRPQPHQPPGDQRAQRQT